jgi:hypothetical protein
MEEILQQYRDEYLNKIVNIEDGQGKVWVGELVFLGYNSFFPSWGLCATIDRLPIQGVKLKSITLNTTFHISN